MATLGLTRSGPLPHVAACTQAVRLMGAVARMTTNTFGVVKCPAISKPFRRVHPGMFFRRDNFKILNTIVGFIAVSVMHMLIRAQRPAQVPLHHKSMLKHLFRLMIFQQIAMTTVSYSALPGRMLRATYSKASTLWRTVCQALLGAIPVNAKRLITCGANEGHPLMSEEATPRTIKALALRNHRRLYTKLLFAMEAGTLNGHRDYPLGVVAGGVHSPPGFSHGEFHYINREEKTWALT